MPTAIGTQFETGQTATVSGVYKFVGHLDGSKNHTIAETRIPLSKGETFPPCRSCNKAAIWQLEQYA